MYLLGLVMGCPCWDMAVRWHQRRGLPVPPELGGP